MSKIKYTIFLFLFFVFATGVSAEENAVSSSANFSGRARVELTDQRVLTLQKFLYKNNSPLTDYAFYFIYFADEYDLDWRLVPAITGVESSFGKRIPKNSYNAYGWNNGNYKFLSWEESIEIVSRTLRQKYYDRGLDSIDKISRRYAPPSKTWGWKVKYFMEKIEPIPIEFEL